MCFFCVASKKLGILFKRDDYINPKIKDLRNALQIQLFEIELFDEAFRKFIIHKYKKFDALVGDCKCQVRASMLVDIIYDNKNDKLEVEQVQQHLNDLKNKVLDLIDQTEMHHVIETKKIIDQMKHLSLYEFFEKNHLNFKIMHDFFYLGISFFLTPYVDYKAFDIYKNITDRKYIKLLNDAKKQLSLISIEYEQNLAKQYCNINIQKILDFIQSKGSCSMTAFYPSFIPIWEKIKDKKQLVLKKTLYFCKCGGLKDIQSEFFRANNKNTFEKIVQNDLQEAAFVIEGYNFEGSLGQLKKIVGAPDEHTEIKQEYVKLCSCLNHLQKTDIENFDDVIFASFVQHAQFTNDAEIPWVELGLESSEFKKEFDRLQLISGCALEDMSVFRINHIYASTVGQELEDQRQLLVKLGKK